MQNPFTTTFSKTPQSTYIETDEINEIAENFSYDVPTESVYKITGVRGSGKTVLLAKIEEGLSSDEAKENGWIVYRLSPARDMLLQLAAMMSVEKFVSKKKTLKSVNVSANILGSGGGVGISAGNDSDFSDIGAELDRLIEIFIKNGKKILIGIDEVSKTDEMIIFASEFGKWLRAGYPIYLVCTGLYENIMELSNVKNLTFFRRASTVKTEPLNLVRMTEMYKNKLALDTCKAREMANLTKGYAYAFQKLGNLYFKEGDKKSLSEISEALKSDLFSYSYEKLWEEMSEGDRTLVTLMTDKDEYSRNELLEKMDEKAGNYSVYRQRLLNRGIITARQGYVSLALPFFNEYIKEYCL